MTCRVTYRTLRRDIIELVLATDMSKHFEHLQRFKHFLPTLIQYYSAQVPPPLLCHNIQVNVCDALQQRRRHREYQGRRDVGEGVYTPPPKKKISLP